MAPLDFAGTNDTGVFAGLLPRTQLPSWPGNIRRLI